MGGHCRRDGVAPSDGAVGHSRRSVHWPDVCPSHPPGERPVSDGPEAGVANTGGQQRTPPIVGTSARGSSKASAHAGVTTRRVVGLQGDHVRWPPRAPSEPSEGPLLALVAWRWRSKASGRCDGAGGPAMVLAAATGRPRVNAGGSNVPDPEAADTRRSDGSGLVPRRWAIAARHRAAASPGAVSGLVPEADGGDRRSPATHDQLRRVSIIQIRTAWGPSTIASSATDGQDAAVDAGRSNPMCVAQPWRERRRGRRPWTRPGRRADVERAARAGWPWPQTEDAAARAGARPIRRRTGGGCGAGSVQADSSTGSTTGWRPGRSARLTASSSAMSVIRYSVHTAS